MARNGARALSDAASHDLLSTMLKCHVLEASSVLLRTDDAQLRSLDVSYLGELAHELVHLTLSPMAALRAKLLPLICTCLSKRDGLKSLSPWRDKQVTGMLVLNLFQLVKTCPTPELTASLAEYFRTEVREDEDEHNFFSRLRGAFNYERKEEPKSFTRRRIVLDVLEAAARERPGWNSRRIHVFLAPFEEAEEIGERVKEVLKVVDYQEEDDDQDGEVIVQAAVPAAGIKRDTKKRRVMMANSRKDNKRRKV